MPPVLLALALALDPAPAVSSPAALCRQLATEDLERPQRCTVVRRARHGDLAAAVLRVTGDRRTELWIAATSGTTWQLVRSAGAVYNVQDLRGRLAVRSLAVHQLVPGGAPEIDLVVSRWQATLAHPDDCSLRKLPEVHRYVVARRDAEWRSLALATATEPASTVALTPGCPAPPWTPPPTWSLALEFTEGALTVRPRAGTVPEDMSRTLATHPLAAVLLPADRPPALATLPDTI
jgi:hypothetical protein